MSILDPSTTFPALCDSLGLDVRLRKAVSRLGHSHPTLVQSKCLPLAIAEGRDLLVRARTGSGKTLVYCLALLHKLLLRKDRRRGVGAVVLVPTRELCSQVQQTLKTLVYYCDELVAVAVLSVGRGRGEKAQQELERQEAALRDQPDVVVATPAGILAHIKSGAIQDLQHVETFVVDEADLILSFGYSRDVAEIVKALPRICQGFLLSATLSPEMESLKRIVLNSPVVLKLEQNESKDATGHLKQFYLSLTKKDKNLVVYVFLKLGLLKGKGLFFVNSTDSGYRLKLFLEQFHIRSTVLNAELPFRSRMNIIEQFNVGNFDYLIATDSSSDADGGQAGTLADQHGTNSPHSRKVPRKDSEYGVSRGLDFRNVSFVVNVDFPPNPMSYAHRVGRTARGGSKGVALSLVDAASEIECNALLQVQEDQPPVSPASAATDQLQALSTDANPGGAPAEQRQPLPLDFDLNEIEGFRYRVEDVSRAVTRTAVRETRAAELRAEILNSERLQSRLEESPADLQLLQHDRLATHVSRVQEHLKHVPKYLLPRGMHVANLNRRKRKRHSKNSDFGARRTDNDPLQKFDGDVALGESPADFAEYLDEGDIDKDSPSKPGKTESGGKIFTSSKDGTGVSTSGRNVWKAKHRKGKFSGKKRRGDGKYGQPLGV